MNFYYIDDFGDEFCPLDSAEMLIQWLISSATFGARSGQYRNAHQQIL